MLSFTRWRARVSSDMCVCIDRQFLCSTGPKRLLLVQNLDFYGVIRFFFQDNQQSVATTKCLRVSSTATSKMVIEALIEKFRPDMRMLGSSYALYEVHQNGGMCVCVCVCVCVRERERERERERDGGERGG